MRSVDLRAVRQRCPLPEVLAAVGAPLRRLSGGRGRGPCPWCAWPVGSGRGLVVTGGVWYCHECGRGGDVTDLVAELYGLGVVAAAVRCCVIAGVAVPYHGRPAGRTPRQRRARSPRYGEGVRGAPPPGTAPIAPTVALEDGR